MLRKTLTLTAALVAGVTLAAQAVKVDPKVTTYKKVAGISGNLNSIGSDTLNNLMTFWSEGFAKHYPNVKLQAEGKGSSTAPPELIDGTAQLGPMSREMKCRMYRGPGDSFAVTRSTIT